jgi:PilZ domain
MSERRQHQRRRTLKGGRIVFNQRFSAINCTVRNLSDGGACIEVANSVGIPDDFDLTIEPEHINRPCHVAWRSEHRIGVAFR